MASSKWAVPWLTERLVVAMFFVKGVVITCPKLSRQLMIKVAPSNIEGGQGMLRRAYRQARRPLNHATSCFHHLISENGLIN